MSVLAQTPPNADFSRGSHKLRRGCVHSDHEDRRCWIALCYLLRGFQSIHHGHREVQNDDIEFVVGELRKRFTTVGRFVAYFPVVLCVQQRFQAASHGGAIIDNQDAGLLRRRWGRFVHPTLMPLPAKPAKRTLQSQGPATATESYSVSLTLVSVFRASCLSPNWRRGFAVCAGACIICASGETVPILP
jgi:hypothetical protein